MVNSAPHSLRTFLAEMEALGELIRIRRPADPLTEIPALCSETTKPILFENVKGYPGWRVVDCLLRFRRHQAIALKCSPENLIPHLAIKYMQGPGKTRLVDDGPVKEIIWKGEDVDLGRLPVSTPSEGIAVPHLNMSPEDFHIRTISGGFGVTKDPVTGVQNCFFPTTQIMGPRRAQFYVFSSHTAENIKRYQMLGRRAPMAVVLGCHPAYEVAAVYTGPHPGYSEIEIAGTLLGETIELVRGETVDLQLPAHAEIIIEGYIDPHPGPYTNVASHTDTYAPIRSSQPYFDVTAITMRRDPIYRHLQPTRWTDHHAICEFIIAPMLYGMLKGKGLPVRDVTIPLHSAINCAVIQMSPRSEEDVREALLTAISMPYMPRLTIAVDEDINIHDPHDLIYALSIRVDPARDLIVLDKVRTFEEDPLGHRIPGMEESIVTSIGRLGIDATKPPPCRPTERILFERLRARGEGRVFLGDFISEEKEESIMTPSQPAPHVHQDAKDILSLPQQGITKVKDGIYVVYELANAGVIIADEGVAVIDTTTSPASAKRVVNEIRKITDKPILYAINTHYHGDHNYGNVVFKELGATIVGSNKTVELMRTREKRVKAFYESRALPMANMVVLPPDMTFDEELELRLGDKTLHLKFYGEGETDDAVAVYIPEEKVLFAGDTVIPFGFPIFGMPVMNEGLRAEGQWIRTLENLEALDIDIVVPGHGRITDKSVLTWMKDIAQFLLREVTAQVAEAKTLDETIAHVLSVMPEEWRHLPRIWGTPEMAVMRVYHSLTGWMPLRRSPIEPAPADELEDVVRRVGRYPRALLEEADKAALAQNYRLAHSLAELACQIEPNNALAHAIRGDILADWGNSLLNLFDKGEFFTQSATATQRALDLDPDCPIPYLNRALGIIGTLPFTGADPAEAIALIRTAIEKGLEGSRVVKAELGLAMAYEAQGDQERAREHYQRALDLFPGLDVAREALNRLSASA